MPIRTRTGTRRSTWIASKKPWACLPCALTLACGDAGGFHEEVTSDEQEIFNGRTAWDPIHERYIMQPTVRIRTAGGGICTGTALRNHIVVTARHCATVDGNLNSTLASPSDISVASSRNVPTAGCNSSTCRTVSVIETFSTTQDVALLILSGGLSVNSSVNGFGMKIEPFAPEFHEPLQLLVGGYGNNTATGGGGTLRQGTVDVHSTSGTWPAGKLNTGRVLETKATPVLSAGGQLMWSGDSGGPVWNQLSADPAQTNITQIPMLLGVHSIRDGSGDSSVAHATIATSFRDWVNTEIFERTPTISNSLTNPSFLSLLELHEPVPGNGGPTNWVITSSGLSEASNFNTPAPNLVGTMMIHRGGVYENFDMRVDVSGTDNDCVGLVMRYIDDSNYVRFSVDSERRAATFVRMHPRGMLTVASVSNFDVDYAAGVELRVVAEGRQIYAHVNGSPLVGFWDTNIMIGRVGLYENAMNNVRFRNWNVTPLAPTTGNIPFP